MNVLPLRISAQQSVTGATHPGWEKEKVGSSKSADKKEEKDNAMVFINSTDNVYMVSGINNKRKGVIFGYPRSHIILSSDYYWS